MNSLLDDVEYDPAEARFVVAASGDEMLVASTSDGLCVAAHGNLTCGSKRDLRAGRLSGAEICGPHLEDGTTHLFGIVPDGVDRVAIRLRDGGVVEEPIVDGVYSVRLHGVPDRVRLVGTRAKREAPVAIPESLSTSFCATTSADG